ncbi:MAG: hypothetical protein RL011_1369 [Pseudomonadota bacterium]
MRKSHDMSDSLVTVNPKGTSQKGLLESILANVRTRKILPYTRDKHVLDFGCGEHLWTLRKLRGQARSLTGYDILYSGLNPQVTNDGITVYGLLEQVKGPIDCIVSLACFEHLEPENLRQVFQKLAACSLPHAKIVGTVPRPPAKPVLEFLSYNLGLIDASQIADHKVYYDLDLLREAGKKGGWEIELYKTFQFGMNSFFVMRKAQ